MVDFKYTILGVEYTVPSDAFTNGIEKKEEDFEKIRAAEENFWQHIGAKFHLDDSRSFEHYLEINRVVIWKNHWRDGEKGNFDLIDLHEAISLFLFNLGLIEESF